MSHFLPSGREHPGAARDCQRSPCVTAYGPGGNRGKRTPMSHRGFWRGVSGKEPEPPEGDADLSDEYFDGYEDGKRLRAGGDDDRMR